MKRKDSMYYAVILEELGDLRFRSCDWGTHVECEQNQRLCLGTMTIHELDKEWIEVSAKEATGVEEKWRPEHGSKYYFVTDGGDVYWDAFYGHLNDEFRLATGNVFRTKEEASKHKEEMLKGK